MKKIVLVLFLLVLLVACSSNDEQSADDEISEDVETVNAEESEKKEMSKTDALYYLESITKEYMGISTHDVFDEDTINLLETGIDNIDLAIEEMEEEFDSSDPLMLAVKEMGDVVKNISEDLLAAPEVNGEMVGEGSHEIGIYLGEISRDYLDGELPPTVENTLQELDEAENEIYSDDVKDFVESFNMLASSEDDIQPIREVEPVDEIEESFSQTLYSSSDYIINAIYSKDGEVESYSVVIPESQPYKNSEGIALYAMLHVGAALDIETEKIVDEFEKSLQNNNNGLFFDDKYSVIFTENEHPDIGMVVMFMNLAFTEDE